MAQESGKPAPRKARRWLRRTLYSLLFLLLALVIFHRPLIHFAGRQVGIWLARKQHMILDLRIGGSIWTRLELHNVSVRADGTGPAPVESASLDHLAAEYDLWRLIKGDL